MNDCNCNKKMSLECDICNPCNSCNTCDPCDPCGSCCTPSCYGCNLSIEPDAFDPRYWYLCLNGCMERIRIPDLPAKDTHLDIDCTTKTMTYFGETGSDVYTGKDLGCILELNDISDVNAPDPEPCSMLVFNPGCGSCPCDPEEDTWQAYKIPDAGDCEVEPDEDGYYHVLVKNDCGCIEECRIPVVPNGMTAINYVRDSVPDDPDFPWYYGCYNDTINLHLAENAAQYFGKFALKVTVNYGVQTILSSQCKNTNFRSLLVPVVDDGGAINVEKESSILQGFSGFSSTPEIPWGSQSLRGSFVFIVPKGKEAYLHHEFRYRTNSSFPNYYTNATYDGKRVPDEIASQVNAVPWNASRLNALQVIVEPTNGAANYEPVVDAERQQLDAAVDEYPSL